MYVPQRQLKNLREAVKPGKVVIVFGARRTGKTTLLKEFLKERTDSALFVSSFSKNGMN